MLRPYGLAPNRKETRAVGLSRFLNSLTSCKDVTDVNIAAGIAAEQWQQTKRRLMVAAGIAGSFTFLMLVLR